MVGIAVLGLSLIVVGVDAGRAQDYCRNRGLHENLRARQANGVPSEQRQLSAAACDQECARGLAKAERGRRRDRRAQKRRD